MTPSTGTLPAVTAVTCLRRNDPRPTRTPSNGLEITVDLARSGLLAPAHHYSAVGIGVCWCSMSRQRPARLTYTLVKRPANLGWPFRCAVTR
jgi:hypothetical protein